MLLRILLLSTFLASASRVLAQNDLATHYTADAIAEILRDEGYRAVEVRNDSLVIAKIDGSPYNINILDDGNLVFYFALAGVRVSYRDINDWNKTKRLSRAYIDDDSDPVVEGDLLTDAGVNPEQLYMAFKIFVDVAGQFEEFVNERRTN